MRKYNTIFTAEEYMAQGFTAEEVPMIERHDRLFNKNSSGLATDEEIAEMYELADKLGL